LSPKRRNLLLRPRHLPEDPVEVEDIIDIDPVHPEGERVPDVAGAAETEAVVRGEGGHQGEGEKRRSP
jgi:hypothetical protein